MSDREVKAPDLASLLEHKSEKWTGFARDVLPLPVAEMDFPVAEPIKKLLHEMVDASDLGYLGSIPEMGTSFAHFAQERWNWKVDPLQVRIGTDVGVAIVEILRVIAKPGDKVLINSPVYQNFYNWLVETGMEKVDVPFTRTGSDEGSNNPWELNWPEIESAYASGIKVHMICSPHNPLGRIYTTEELLRFVGLAKKYNVIIISDEIHAPLTFKDSVFIPTLALGPDAESVCITVTAASKGWNIAGLKCAIIITQNEEMKEKMTHLPFALHYRASLPGAYASAIAFKEGGIWLDTVIAILDQNRYLIQDLLAATLPSVKYHIPQNGYLAWLDLTALNLGEDPGATLIERGKVAFNSGHFYAPQTSQYVRLNFATSPEIITEAIHRIRKAL
jgi:cysteine-S-conjugate beta-lyase